MKKILLLFFILSSFLPPAFSQVVSFTPNVATQGQTLLTTITMAAGQFSQGSPPYQQSDIYIQQGATIYYTYAGYNTNNVYWGTDSLWTYFNIPSNAPLGYYDLHVIDYDQFWTPTNYVLTNGLFVGPYAGTIEGDLYNDLNQNGTKDLGEPPLPNHRVGINPGNHSIYADLNGHYKAYLDSNNYTVSYIPNISYSQTSLPATYNATVPPDYTGFDFGAYSAWLSYNQYFYVWHHPMRCQPSLGYTYVDITNNATIPVQGTVTMILSPNISLNSANPVPTINGDTLRWTYPILNPGQSFHIGGTGLGSWMSFNDPPAGQTLWYTTIDSVFDSGGNPLTAYSDTFSFLVTCSCDPNDKNVSPVGVAAQHYTPPNSELTYTINFQNTGNDTAFTVMITDTLDPNLDWNTFEVISSTHPVNTQMDPNGVVTFTFQNIQLPDSNVNEPGSHGAVAYHIRTDSLLPDPTEITNTSYIYFDWNPPVVTNTTLNTITAMQYPSAVFSTGDVSLCPGTCVSYSSAPNPGSTFMWSFPGAIPSSSTDPNPANICYLTGGLYDASLIVTNALGADTVLYQDYLEVYTTAAQSIIQVGDTLFAETGFVSYVWYYNGNIINGATSYYYVATQNGDYHVIAYDVNGCDVEAAALGVLVTSVNQILNGTSISIYPNPAKDMIVISGVNAEVVSIYNVLGERVLYNKISSTLTTNEIDITSLPPGNYSVEVTSGDNSYRASIVKQ